MGIRLPDAAGQSNEGDGPPPVGVRGHASAFPAQVPPHAELPLIRAFVESLRHLHDGGTTARGETPATLRRTVETLAAILDLHGEFGAADEARAIVAALGRCS